MGIWEQNNSVEIESHRSDEDSRFTFWITHKLINQVNSSQVFNTPESRAVIKRHNTYKQ